MVNHSSRQHQHEIQAMFTRTARRYDLMNRLMTAGQDIRWRREVIRRAGLPAAGRLLDIGAGTGDLGREALRQVSDASVYAVDFTQEMMRVGQRNHGLIKLVWCVADALYLPFHDNVFDAVVSGFLLRNVSDVNRSLQEQFRVVKPGGRIVCLDTSPPPKNLLSPFIRFHLHAVIPLLGALIARQAEAYHYLPASTESFLPPEALASRMIAAGLEQVGFQRLMFGSVAIHWGRKPMQTLAGE